MAGLLIKGWNHVKEHIRKLFIEILALWFALKHPRVRWYAKFFILIPLGYVISPIDLIPDALSLFGIGQIDDLLVLRYSYILLKKMISQNILDECRKKSVAYLAEKNSRRLRIVIEIAAVWIIITTLLAMDIYKRLHRHSIF